MQEVRGKKSKDMKFGNKIGKGKEEKKIIKELAEGLYLDLQKWAGDRGLKFSKSIFLSCS